MQPPVAVSEDIALLRFEAPAPTRTIALFWRKTSAYREFLPELAAMIRDIAAPLVAGTRLP